VSINYRLLGQSAPSATTLTSLYTCGSGIQTVVSSISVANRGTVSATYRLAIRDDGSSIANQHYLAYDASIPANDSIILTLGIVLEQNDILSVFASNADLTFQAFGAENS
jgi:hypothetical protein